MLDEMLENNVSVEEKTKMIKDKSVEIYHLVKKTLHDEMKKYDTSFVTDVNVVVMLNVIFNWINEAFFSMNIIDGETKNISVEKTKSLHREIKLYFESKFLELLDAAYLERHKDEIN